MSNNVPKKQLVSITKSKYDQLIQQFQKIKAQNTTQVKMIQEHENGKLELERKLKQCQEENEVLRHNNDRLEKRVKQMMHDLEQQSRKGWFTSGNSSQTELEATRHELSLKIQENETIHQQIFQLKMQGKQDLADMENDLQQALQDLQKKEKELLRAQEEFQLFVNQRKEEKKEMSELMLSLRTECRQKGKEAESRKKIVESMKKEITELQEFCQRKVPFDDTKYDAFHILNSPPFSKPDILQAIELQERTLMLVKQFGKGFNALLTATTQKIDLLVSGEANQYSSVLLYVHNILKKQPLPEQHRNELNNLLNQIEIRISDFKASVRTENMTDEKLSEFEKHRTAFSVVYQSYLTFVKRSFVYIVLSIQHGKCHSSGEGGGLQFDDIYMQDGKVTHYLDVLRQLIEKFLHYHFSNECSHEENGKNENEISHEGNPKNDLFLQIPGTTSHRTRGKSFKLDQQDHSIESRSRSSSDPSVKVTEIFHDYLNPPRVLESPSLPNPKEHRRFYNETHIQLKSLVNACGDVIREEQKYVFISPSLKSVNEKISTFLTVVESLYSKFVQLNEQYENVREEVESKFIRGAKQRCLKKFDANSEHPICYADVVNVHREMQNKQRNFLTLLRDQYQTDFETFENISQEEALELRRQLEKLEGEKEQLDKLSKKYKDALCNVISRVEQITRDKIPNVSIPEQLKTKSMDALKKRFQLCVDYLENANFAMEVDKDFDDDTGSATSDDSEEEKTNEIFGMNVIATPTQSFELFNPELIDRETKLKEKYEYVVNQLKDQIRACDAKAVDFQLSWQDSVSELEQAYQREKGLQLHLRQSQQMVETLQDEIDTIRENFEEKIGQLSLSLTNVQTNGGKTFFSGGFFSGEK